MSDNRDIIRQEMDQTKSQLSDKLQLLQLQIAETAQSTGTAVNATVEAVKGTVETVQTAAESVRNAFDVRRRISMHPWLVLGACAGLGYLAGRRKRSFRSTPLARLPPRSINLQEVATGATDTSVMATAIAAAYEKGLKNSSWDLLRNTAMAAAIEIVQDIAFRVAPKLLDRLTAPSVETRPESLNAGRGVQVSQTDLLAAQRKEPCTPKATSQRPIGRDSP